MNPTLQTLLIVIVLLAPAMAAAIAITKYEERRYFKVINDETND